MARSTSRALHTRLAKVIRRCNLVGIRPSRWLSAWTVLLLLLFRLLSYGGEPLLPAVFVSVSPLRLQPLGEYAIDEVHTPEISRSSSHEAERMLLQGVARTETPPPGPTSDEGLSALDSSSNTDSEQAGDMVAPLGASDSGKRSCDPREPWCRPWILQRKHSLRSDPWTPWSSQARKSNQEPINGASSAAIEPSWASTHSSESRVCPAGLYRIPVAIGRTRNQDEPPVCDECGDYGVCPVLPQSAEPSTLAIDAAGSSRVLNAVALKAVAPRPGGAINPCIFTHQGATLVVYRSTTALRCRAKSVHGEFDLDNPELGWQNSHVGICRLRHPVGCPTCSITPMDCVSWPSSLHISNLEELAMRVDPRGFVGVEDPRGFSFQGVVYVIANIGMRLKPWDPEFGHCTLRKRRILLVALDADLHPERTLMLTLPSSRPTLDDKNVVPLISPDAKTLYLVHSFVPYGLCKLDLDTGVCHQVDIQSDVPGGPEMERAMDLNGQLRGSTALALTALGYLGLVHRKQQLELGRVYTHKWVLLNSSFPHVPIWLSAPFRLPLTERAVAEDVQFAAGVLLHLQRGTATVSYGVADCFSWFAEVQLPMTEIMTAAQEASYRLQLLRPVLPTVHTGSPSTTGRVRVRWEAPMTGSSGFAMASRPFALRLEADPHVELQVIDNEQPSDVYDANTYRNVYRRIARSNTQLLPDVHLTVRMGWPPNFHSVLTGKLVMYLPWEFEVIPNAWVEALNAVAEEVWVPARFVAAGMIRSGVRAEKLHVVGHGAPDGACAQPLVQRIWNRKRPFRFLFHGGLLWRKGVDLLLMAYLSEFSVQDDVELVIHTQYGDAPVQSLVEGYLKRAHSDPMAPTVILREEVLSTEQLEELLAQTDALVHSSRSEGFGLGILEAMARGIPVILPAYGPPTEFVDNSTGFLFQANAVACTRYPCDVNATSVFSARWTTSSPLMWGDYKPKVLARTMRDVFSDPAEAAARGTAARRSVCSRLAWDRVHSSLQERLAALSHYSYSAARAPAVDIDTRR